MAPSSAHVLFDGPALQPFERNISTSMMGFNSEIFGDNLIPELSAVERAAEGLQRAVNSELRHLYTTSPLQDNPRDLRLLVALWEAKGVEGLLNTLASKLRDSSPTMLTSTGDCAICTEQSSPDDMIIVEGCGHATCKGCLREYIGARLEERVWPILCPICMAESGQRRRAQRTL